MINKKDIKEITTYIDSLFPNAKCELFYNKDYELAIAVMLSAQTTDKAVNNVTKVLFNKFPTLESIDNAPLKDIEEAIKSLGLYARKSINIKGIAHKIIESYNGKLPSDKDELQSLPGIGNKSAGVIRCEVFKIPDLPVDTHIIRITNRLGIANKNDSSFDIEQKLKKLIPEKDWIKSHHQFIHFGRYFCTAKNPCCKECALKKYCNN
ncbi:MAG: endonuclease III [Bacilli bacterium]|nr:endonuclease III [Bacilli bacterium]